ncbi:MAG: hypothetical protein B6I28_05135 [Fusobacteriia bacterium 4572_132]|nr:MAG: hypothetical protein B6I28_05135 [Fusobacteriia bacterium 4572_132]
MYVKYDRKLKRYRDSSGRFISKEKAQELKREIKKVEKYGKNYLKAKKIGIVFDAKTKKYRDINTGKFIKTEEALKSLEGRRSIYIISSKSGKIYRNKYWQDKEKKQLIRKKVKLSKECFQDGIVKTCNYNLSKFLEYKNEILYINKIYEEELLSIIKEIREKQEEKESGLYFYIDVEIGFKDKEDGDFSFGSPHMKENEPNTKKYIKRFLDDEVFDFINQKIIMIAISDGYIKDWDFRMVWKEWTNPQKHYKEW